MEEFNKLAKRRLAQENAGIADKTDENNQRAAKALNTERANALLRAIEIPKRYKTARLSDEPPDSWKRAAGANAVALQEEYRSRLAKFITTHGIVALIGNRGTGKTQLAFATLIEAAKNLQSGKYIKAAELFIEIEGTWGRGKQTGPDLKTILKRLIAPDLLVIDELSEMQADKDWQSGRLTYVLDARYDRELKTLLISNDTAETFTRNMGESSMSRLAERGRILPCTWKSFRDCVPND
jgi:DNA replication protein DnaC